MAERTLIVGAGLIGCSIALHLAEAGHSVRVVDRAGPAAGASGASFGWINASFYHDADHHRLRVAGLAAYNRLLARYPNLPVTWQPTLWFEDAGPALAEMRDTLRDLNYALEHIDHEMFSRISPGVSAPAEALLFSAEGVAEPAALNHALAAAAQALGVQFLLGQNVRGLIRDACVCGVMTDEGPLPADRVIVAAGTGAADLIDLPMLHRPGALLKTQPLPPLLAHVLVAPEGEIRQDSAGCLVMPTAVGHQADSSDSLSATPVLLADAALARLQARIPGMPLHWTHVQVAQRPVPQDGLPVVGPVAPGLYAAVMHSGVTLAALVGELVAAEVAGSPSNLLGPYRPERFF